ncbi:MAG: CRISPR system precrRNA processing endoribonuclease RAMP protein Cas6 [candidate division WOR-3 bacterium]
MKVAKLKINYRVIDILQLNQFIGSILRGAFGYIFRKITCPNKNQRCSDCLLKSKCIYLYIFETPRPENSQIMRKYESIPRPFIIEPPLNNKQIYKPGENFIFNLILIGRAIEYIPYFIYTLEEIGNYGIGKNRGHMSLVSITQGLRKIYNGGDRKILANIIPQKLSLTKPRKPIKKITIKFLTPFRIIYQEKLTQSLDFHVLIRSLLRRIGLLSYFHADEPYKIDFKYLISKAEKIQTIKANLMFQEQYRYSTRQQQRISIAGMIGEFTYQGDLTEFLPYLKIGEVVHVGKGTVFGMGKYKLEVME